MEEVPILEINPEQIECPSEGGKFEIVLQGPHDWVTDNTADWIDIQKENDSALVCIEPAKGADRQTRIMFKSGSQRDFLYIRQYGAHIFSLSATEIETDYKGGSFIVSVECHEPWTVSCDSEWITTDIDGASSPQDVTLNIAASHEKESRKAEVRFVRADETLSVVVTQGPGPYIALEKEIIEVDGDGGTFRILYISNTDVVISTSDEWLRLIGGQEGQQKIAFEILRNTAEAREGSITITSVADPEYGKTLRIK